MAQQTRDKDISLPVPTPTPEGIMIGKTLRIPSDEIASDELPDHLQQRDYLIAGGVMLVLLISFFFVKNAYANHLVKKRVSVGSSNAAGWCLFIFLTALAAGAILSILIPSMFLTLIPLALVLAVCLLSLILMFVIGRRS